MKVDSLKNDEAEIQKTDLVPEVKPALKVRKKSFKNPKFKNTINKKIMIHKIFLLNKFLGCINLQMILHLGLCKLTTLENK